MVKMPDFPVLQRDIAPGTAAQVDMLMDFWLQGNLPPQDMVRLLTLLPPHAASLSYQGDTSSLKDGMGPHSSATRTCLVWSCLSA